MKHAPRHWARRALHELAPWTIPPRIGQGAAALLRRVRLLPHQSRLARNFELSDRHSGQRGFVLATGPSIRQQDLSPLRGEICLAVSNFFVHPECERIAPRYWILAPYHPPITEEAYAIFLGELEAAIEGSTTMLLPLQDRQRIRDLGLFRSSPVHWVATGGDQDHISRHGPDLCQPVLAFHSVTVMALQAALYMGLSEVILLGCDHDWLWHYGRSEHFYEADQSALQRDGYDEWFDPDIGRTFETHGRLWGQYRTLQSVARARSCRIVNATPKSKLDLFERVELTDLV